MKVRAGRATCQKPHICQRKANMGHGRCGPPAGFFSYAGWLDVTGMALQIYLKAAEGERKRERAGIAGPVGTVKEY